MNESIIISASIKAHFSSSLGFAVEVPSPRRFPKTHFSSHASLAGIGRKVKKLKLFEPVTQKVRIAQKVVKYTPGEKLIDAFIALLTGAQGMVEVNKRLKADVRAKRAFG